MKVINSLMFRITVWRFKSKWAAPSIYVNFVYNKTHLVAVTVAYIEKTLPSADFSIHRGTHANGNAYVPTHSQYYDQRSIIRCSGSGLAGNRASCVEDTWLTAPAAKSSDHKEVNHSTLVQTQVRGDRSVRAVRTFPG